MATNLGKFKIPKIRSEDEAQAAARNGKRNLSKSDGGQDSSLTSNTKIKQGDTSREDGLYSEDGCKCICPGVLDSHCGGANQQTQDTGYSYRTEKKNRSGGGHSSDRPDVFNKPNLDTEMSSNFYYFS